MDGDDPGVWKSVSVGLLPADCPSCGTDRTDVAKRELVSDVLPSERGRTPSWGRP